MTTRARIGDDALDAATGRNWTEWIAALDHLGAAMKTHKEIVALLRERLGLDKPWWGQMVAVGYEQAKGLRAVHEQGAGFAANVSRTLQAPVGDVFAAWNDSRRRAGWLPDPLTVRKSTPGKSLRITWADGTNVDVNLTAKSAAKSIVAIEHAKLADAKSVVAKKAYWKDALARLAARLES